jgi:hypothetical protein
MSGNVEDAQAKRAALELLQRFDRAFAQAISQGIFTTRFRRNTEFAFHLKRARETLKQPRN